MRLERFRFASTALLALALTLVLARPAAGLGEGVAEYLLVGTGSAEVAGTTIAISNFEVGANRAVVPMPGLTLVEAIPPNTLPVPTGVPGDGDLALTDPGGRFDYANLAIEGEAGVLCAASASACNDGVSNTTFNGLSFPDNGLSGGIGFSALRAELESARNQIAGLARDALLTFPAGDWDLARIDLSGGLTVFDIDTGGNDLVLQNRNLVIDGPAGAVAIFRVPDAANFLVSQAALLLGNGGIQPGSVLFFSEKPDTNAHFSFSNAVVNGIAFWDLGGSAGEVAFNDVQGCTQVIGDKLNLNDVRLTRCAFLTVPEPDAAALGFAALAAVTWLARSRSTRGRASHSSVRG
jgi:hypothetical protein